MIGFNNLLFFVILPSLFGDYAIVNSAEFRVVLGMPMLVFNKGVIHKNEYFCEYILAGPDAF